MRGRFVGETSMGFVHGQTYELTCKIMTITKGRIPMENCICLFDVNSNAWCPYSKFENILKNWNFNVIQ